MEASPVTRFTQEQARSLLRDHRLRVTAPRLAVLRVLAEASQPLSHNEVLERLGDTRWDPATIYRNLVKLRDAGVAPVVTRAEGIHRYALSGLADGDHHQHPHFYCETCGRVTCMPPELSAALAMTGPWGASVDKAMVQLHGECPECASAGASSASPSSCDCA